jgi:hypothetical protein
MRFVPNYGVKIIFTISLKYAAKVDESVRVTNIL